ncbi:MAG: carbohydrate binding domain-containing protein [Roseburia sp.]|nr:carbohydrate binding domain-containing protein [Roseburia sp.]
MKLTLSDKDSRPISKDMYGLFFEDINYSLDGGLHAELLENRNFEAVLAYGKKDDYRTVYDGGYAWSVYRDNGAGSFLSYDSSEPLNDRNPHYLVFTGRGKQPAFTNKAYDGIYLRTGESYTVSFYVRAEETVEVSVSVRRSGKTFMSGSVAVAGNEWKQYRMELTAGGTVEQGSFVVSLDKEAVVCFDQFSMMPKDAVCGVFRADLAEKLRNLHPSFLRFPGGCIIEGNTLENRYQWKNTIAPTQERRFNWNRWAVHNCNENTGFSGPYAHYGQTCGVGFYEYFLLCEYLGAKPLPVVNVGLACQYMSTEQVEPDSEEMQTYIQDALDLIEFANGAADTEWGAKRAAMGHPEPFGLEYMGIGNEQWQTERSQFFERYAMFEQRIHEKYPQMKLIGSAGPDVWSENYTNAWSWLREAHKRNANLAYAVDEHYYVSPEWLYAHTHFYDNYDRSIKVFAGEYACHIKGRAGKMNNPAANTLGAALAEAAFLTGVERNADVVVLASYAPLLARMGYTQWSPDLIWFDGKSSYCTPSYHVQELFSKYRGSRTLHITLDLDGMAETDARLFASAVEDEDGSLILKLVNGSENDYAISLEGELLRRIVGKPIILLSLTGSAEAQNTIEAPDAIHIEESRITLSEAALTIPKNSFQVLVISAGNEPSAMLA